MVLNLTNMARFILDVLTDDIGKVLDVIDRDDFLNNKVSWIRCIDETSENQFYVEGYGTNELTEKQIQNDKEFFK